MLPSRIAIDARTILGRKTGDRTYILNLLQGLARIQSDYQFAVLLDASDSENLVARATGDSPRFKIALTLGFKYSTWPFPVTDSTVPAFSRQTARDPAHYAVVDVPLSTSARAMSWQTVHGKPILLGHLARPFHSLRAGRA